MKRTLKLTLSALLLVLTCAPALAQDNAKEPAQVRAAADDRPLWAFEVKGGVSLLLNAKSFAIAHRLRETVRVAAEYIYDEDLHLGVELVGTGLGNADYRLIGVYFNAIAPLYAGSVFQLRLIGGWGFGTGPAILATDLTVDHPVTLYVQAGLQFRWTVIGDLMTLGIDLLDENINLVTATGTVGFMF